MPIKIVMPVPVFHAFLGRCVLFSREYAILRNSVIDHIPGTPPSDWVEILCDRKNGELILDHARRVYPDAASYIENSMSEYSLSEHPSAMQYRKLIHGDTWHFESACSQWPGVDYIDRQDPPRGHELCNECIVRGQQKR